MCIFSKIRIQFHVLCKVMHPPHIPLQSKSKSVILRRSCHLRPCCRLFCNHHNAFISSANYRIQMFKECNRLKILISAKFIRNPLSIFSSVVQIQHRCHCIYTKSVYMIMFNPERCSPFLGSGYSNVGVPSKSARPCASFGKCAGTQSRITPILFL